MKPFLIWFFSPRWNKHLLIGGLLIIFGFILLPFILGLPILAVGVVVFCLGVFLSLAEKIPGGKFLVEEYERLFKKMSSLLQQLIKVK